MPDRISFYAQEEMDQLVRGAPEFNWKGVGGGDMASSTSTITGVLPGIKVVLVYEDAGQAAWWVWEIEADGYELYHQEPMNERGIAKDVLKVLDSLQCPTCQAVPPQTPHDWEYCNENWPCREHAWVHRMQKLPTTEQVRQEILRRLGRAEAQVESIRDELARLK